MTAIKMIERLLQQEPQTGTKLARSTEAAKRVVRLLLDESPLVEASVHRPTRSRIWVATFTGPTGGQIWRSTGLSDHNQALLLAR